MKKALFVCVLAMLLLPMVSLAKILPPLQQEDARDVLPTVPTTPTTTTSPGIAQPATSDGPLVSPATKKLIPIDKMDFVDMYDPIQYGEAGTGTSSGTNGTVQRFGILEIKIKYATQWEEFWSSTASKTPSGTGWTTVKYDLNKDAGGNYIYLHYRTGWSTQTDVFITDIAVVGGNSSSVAAPAGFTKINVDLNKGAGGDWIFLCYKKTKGGTPITALDIIEGPWFLRDTNNKYPGKYGPYPMFPPAGYDWIEYELNRGCKKGNYTFYLGFLK